MAKGALPILLIGGAAVLAMGGKKKKKNLDDAPDIVPDVNDFPPLPPPSSGTQTPYWKKAGNPPRGDSYDGAYWGADGDERLTSIRQYFSDFGYTVDVGPWPMNVLGPKGSVELTNYPGSTPAKGKLGGWDDEPSPTVKRFQLDYNAVSQSKKFGGSAKMGGLAPDGAVGPFTLNGLRFVKENLGGKSWKDAVAQAALAGYKS